MPFPALGPSETNSSTNEVWGAPARQQERAQPPGWLCASCGSGGPGGPLSPVL